MKIEYRHQDPREISNIWESPYEKGRYMWSNVCGEGDAPSFDEAIREAEKALNPSVIQLIEE